MNKFMALICLAVIAISGCGGSQSTPSPAVTPDPQVVVVPPKVTPCIEPSDKPIVDVAKSPAITAIKDTKRPKIQELEIIIPNASINATRIDIANNFNSTGKISAGSLTSSDNIVNFNATDSEVQSAQKTFSWTSVERVRQVKVLTSEERADLENYDLGSDIALDCIYEGNSSLLKHLLVTPHFLATEMSAENNPFQFQDTVSVDQDIGPSDYSFTGIFHWTLGRRITQTRAVGVTCNRAA